MQPHTRVSDEEYLARERRADAKSELVNGLVVAMAGASLRHNAIVRNLLVALGTRLRGNSCKPYPSDVRIHVPATGLYTYPNVAVICDPPQRHPKDDETFLNPRLLVEVLSKSTEAHDRGAKFAHYRSIVSLSTYVMVASDECRLERYDRAEHRWILEEYVGEGAMVALPILGVTFPLAELYVDLPVE